LIEGDPGLNDPPGSERQQQIHQESYYGDEVNYRAGSPHLKHWPLYDRLVRLVRQSVVELTSDGVAPNVLEIGAGHGGYTEPVLAAGCRVTAVEASRPSLRELHRRYGSNSGFQGVFDPDGSLNEVDDAFSLILIVSVLHHVPDYLSFLDRAMRLLVPGGILVALQDPMWYARLGSAHTVDRAGYYIWRLNQGNWRQGAATILRRLRGTHDPANPADMVEYHVVRNGVDELAVVSLLENRFEAVSMITYWSNQLGLVQRLGDRLRLENTFGVVARGYSPKGCDGALFKHDLLHGDDRPC
jgi:SAM-dependent methyltransferase